MYGIKSNAQLIDEIDEICRNEEMRTTARKAIRNRVQTIRDRYEMRLAQRTVVTIHPKKKLFQKMPSVQ